jgi:NADPH:quinone reductase-like Zn-dependent oxidoreductase
MRSVEIESPGDHQIKVRERPVPMPGPGEIVVQIHAATLNYRDLVFMQGTSGLNFSRYPYVPLSCACGSVSATGEGVTRVAVGDRVSPIFFQNWFDGPQPPDAEMRPLGGPIDGVAADFLCFSENGVVKIPDTLGDLEAATLPCAGVTAWNALYGIRATKPGDVVLLMGTGGVSIIGLQLAKAGGATAIITSSSDAKLERARALGADHGINYRSVSDWGRRARELTGGRGADVVLEVGGRETLAQSLLALRDGGDVAGIGLLAGTPVWLGAEPRARLQRIRVGSREHFEDLLRAIMATGIRPVVDRVYPLERLGDAFRALKAGQMFGKIGISFNA